MRRHSHVVSSPQPAGKSLSSQDDHLLQLPFSSNEQTKRRKRPRSSSTRLVLPVLLLCLPAVIFYVPYYHGQLIDTNKSSQQQHSNDISFTLHNNYNNSSSKFSIDNPHLQHYKIPRVLTFTHYKQLLTEDPSTFDDEEEVAALADNIRHSIQLHQHNKKKNVGVNFLTDRECIASLRRVYPSLVPYFEQEEKGMFKADICRGSALYETGGFYVDADVGLRHDLWSNVAYDTEFITVRVHAASAHPGNFFQAIIGVVPQSPILWEYLKLFEAYYDRRSNKHHHPKDDSLDGKPLGVILLRRAWDNIYNADTKTPRTTLWQEILYSPKLFPTLDPAPVWGGNKRACHFVVAAKALSDELVDEEVSYQKKDGSTVITKMHVPAYSRIAGSRMCNEAAMKQRAAEEAEAKLQSEKAAS
jgi:hypothetical protein